MSEWMSEEQAAEWMNVSIRDIREAVRRGELPALRIGSTVRLSRTGLVTRAGGVPSEEWKAAAADIAEAATDLATPRDGRVPVPVGFRWRTELSNSEPFVHPWPQRGGGSYKESYPRAWAGAVSLGGTEIDVLVGEATGAERHDRQRRLTVLFDNYPMVEFAPTTDAEGWASLIKPDGRHTVSLTDQIPRFYRPARIEPYQQATGLRGRGRPAGAAVVIAGDDRESAVYHAAARWLAKHGRPVEPAA